MKIEKLNEKVDWKVAMEGNNSNIDRLRNVATQVNIDPVMGEVVRENEESDKMTSDTFKKLSKELDGITPKDPDTGKKITMKPYTEKLSLDESLFDDTLNEKKSSKKKKHLCESSSDGWDGNKLDELKYILDKLENLNYEINNCVRGAYSYCKTYEELGHYILDLADSLGNIGEDVSLYVEDEEDDDEEYDESLNEAKSKQPKFWNSMFATKVIDAYKDGKLSLDNIDEWETEYNGGIKPTNLGTKEILTYHINTGRDPRNESLEESKKKELSEDWVVEPEAVLKTKNGDEITIKNLSSSIESDGKVSLKIEYDYVLANGKFGHIECSGSDISKILNGKLCVDDPSKMCESVSLNEYVDESDVEEDEYTVYDLLNDRLFGYGINKSNFRQKWKFAEVEPTVKTSSGKLKRGYFYPTIHADELVTGKPDDRRAFVDSGVGVFVHDDDEATLAKKCAEELKLDFNMKKLVRPMNGFNYIAVIKVPDEIQEMPVKDYIESIGKSMKDFLRGKGEKSRTDFTGSANYASRKEKE